jgi:hypothetical protein
MQRAAYYQYVKFATIRIVVNSHQHKLARCRFLIISSKFYVLYRARIASAVVLVRAFIRAQYS